MNFDENAQAADQQQGEAPDSVLRCDTCGRPTRTVSRVVVDSGYNRANARPLYNCPECYERKLQDRLSTQAPPPGNSQ